MNREVEPILIPSNGLSMSLGTKYSDGPTAASESGDLATEATSAGQLIINADDWGRDHETSERIFKCFRRGSVSSVSAMVFMEDSERAAAMSRESGIDAGLHLNFTTPFSGPNCPALLVECQHELATYLLRHPLARGFFNPWLIHSFEYVVAAQLDEFRRLYGADPARLDGHHHMHLCANVLFKGLLPSGTIVRRNFTFQRGEKSVCNRMYRKALDLTLASRYQIVDFLFSLAPLGPPGRLQRIFSLARGFIVELETHPVNPDEYRFLTEGEIFQQAREIPIARHFVKPKAESHIRGSHS